MTSLTLHTVLMFIAFGLIVPITTILTRYYKILPKQDFPRVLDSKFWWHIHLIMNITATMMMSIALYFMVTGDFTSLHGKFGIITAILVYLQIVSGLLRGTKGSKTEEGDHFNMSQRRRIFEFYHKKIGWIIILLSIITMGLGFINTENWVNLTIMVLMMIGYNYWIADCMGAKRHVDTWKATFGEKE